MRKQILLRLAISLLTFLLIFTINVYVNGDVFESVGFNKYESALINTITTFLFVFLGIRFLLKNDFFIIRFSRHLFNVSAKNYKHENVRLNKDFEKALNEVRFLEKQGQAKIFIEQKNNVVFTLNEYNTTIIDIIEGNKGSSLRIYNRLIYDLKNSKRLDKNQLERILTPELF